MRPVERRHADRGLQRAQGPDRRALHSLEHALHHRLRAGEVGLGQEDRELVRAGPAGQVVRAGAGPEHPTGGREHLVADHEPVLGVHRSEAVDVEEGGAQRPAVAARPLDLDVELGTKPPEVEQPGERVVARLEPDPALELGDLAPGVGELALEVLAKLTCPHLR